MALYADAERGRYPVWQSFDHPDYFPGSGVLFVTVTVRPPSPEMDYSQLIAVDDHPKGRFLSPDRNPHRLPSKIRDHDDPQNEDVPTPLALRNPRSDRFLLREVVE